MSAILRHIIRIDISCPACGKKTAETVARLAEQNSIPCSYCRVAIDLSGEDHRVLLKKLEEFCRNATITAR